MWSLLRRHDNAWIEADRREFRRTVLMVLSLVFTVLGGAAFLIYGLSQ